MPGQFPDAAPGEFPDAQGSGSSGPLLIGPLHAIWVSGNAWAVGDTEPNAVLLLVDAGNNNAPVPVDSTMTIKFVAHSQNDRSIGNVSGFMSPVYSQTGQVEYLWQPGDISVPGTQIAQIHVTVGNETFTFPDDGFASYTVTSL